MYTDSTLRVITDSQAFTHINTGAKFPKNFPKNEIGGLFLVTETGRPVNTETEITTGFIIDETHTQVWQTRAKTIEELENDKNIFNAKVDRELLDANMKIIDALLVDDTARIDQHNTDQETLRVTKKI